MSLSADPAPSPNDAPIVAVTSVVLGAGGVWRVRCRLPNGKLVQLSMPSRAVTLATVMVAAQSVALLVETGVVTP